jgi:acetyl-CoA carboxylase biotin carboxyl carrier protein
MFTFEELCELIRVVSEARVGSIEVEREGMRVRIEGMTPPASIQPLVAQPLIPAPHALTAAVAPARSLPEGESDDGLAFVTSPIVGTFYRAPSPEAEVYVKVGDRVEKGQVLCIVEAMKLMNEIESDAAGTIAKIYPENAQPVEFGERLFAIRPS